MTRLVRAIYAVLPLLITVGCSPIYYAPNTQNVPMLEGKGDGTFGLHLANNGGDLQGAYALTNHVGFMVNVASFKQRDDSQGDGGTGSMVDVGVGYQRNLGSRVVWENYVLLGGGSLENHFPSTVTANAGTTGKIDAKFSRVGFQPSISLHSRGFDAAFSVKFSSVKYSDVSGSLIHNSTDQVAYLNGLDRQLFVEPAFTLRGGWNPIKLQLQLGFSKDSTDATFKPHMREGYLALGVLYQLRRDHSSGGPNVR